MIKKKISQLDLANASLSGYIPMSDSAGTVTNKVTVQSIINLASGVVGGGGGEDTALRALFLPPAPTNLAATAGNAQASLLWAAPSATYIPPITDYVVQYSSNSGSTWTTFSDGTSGSTGATVTGLTNDTAYVFRVAAVNGVGTGAYTAATESATPSAAVFRAIPTMTGYTTPSGEASSSVAESSGFAWNAFDGDNSTVVTLMRQPSNNPVRALSYTFPEGLESRISGYSIRGDAFGPGNWIFYGSQDGTNWTQLDQRGAQNEFQGGAEWPPQTTRTFTLAALANYRSYKWVFEISPDSSSNVNISSIQLIA